MNLFSTFTVPGVIFLLTFPFGFWLSKLGKPYNGLLFNVHKLLALGAVVVTAVQCSKTLKAADPAALAVVLLIVAAVCVVALFASGALMSTGRLDYALMRAIHRIAPIGLAASMILSLYLLGRTP